MDCESSEIFQEGISKRLASVLNLPFPLKDDAMSLTDAQYEILERTDNNGNTQLITAAEHGERGSIEFLIHHGADVNYRNTNTYQTAIDLAWEREHYECMLVLLQADSDFPETFDLDALLNDDKAPEELKSYVKEIDQLHEWIQEGNVEKIEEMISKYKNLRYVNSDGQSAMETAARNGNTNVLACLLGVPFPIPSGKVSLSEGKARLLTIPNTLGEPPLLSAAREGWEDYVNLLIRSGANVYSRDTSGRTAVDFAWGNHHYKVVLVLLEADSEFPADFTLDRLVNGDSAEELKEFVGQRSELHEHIRLGKLQDVKNFVRENPKPSTNYLNSDGHSALYTAISNKKYEIYAFLKSVGVYFKAKEEEIIQNTLTNEEKGELNNYLIRYFPKLPDSHIWFLVSKSKCSRPRNDFRDTVYSIYKNLNEIPLISKILEVIQYADYLEIIFDFDREDVSQVEPRYRTTTRGATDYKSGRLYVGFKMDTLKQELESLGTLAHELTHLAMQITFQNDCNPYEKHDTLAKSHFLNTIVSKVKESCLNFTCDIDIIKRVFTDYKDPDDWPAELIVRVPQILAQHGEHDGIGLVSTYAPELFSYFKEDVSPKCDMFVQQNYLIKPRNMVRTLNHYLGNLSKLEMAKISFTDIPYGTEFFDSRTENVLLVNTSNTWLSSLCIHEELIKITQYSLSQTCLYLQLNDFRAFQKDILNAFTTNVNNILVVECHNKIEPELLSNAFEAAARVLRQSTKKKVVLIVHRDDITEVKNCLGKERHSFKMKEHKDKQFSLADLSYESQMKFIEGKVMFQGRNTDLKYLIHEGTTNIVDSETLVRLIKNEEITIGKEMVGLGEIKNYYIDRVFKLHNEISQNILKDKCISDLFFIGGSKVNELNNFLFGPNVHTCTKDSQLTEEQQFSELCDNYVNHNIHYLRLVKDNLIWIKTRGSISNLRKYVRNESSITYSESDIMGESWDPGPVIIISDTAGMGKTTAVTNLSLKIKHKFPLSWVFRIELNNYYYELIAEQDKKENSLVNSADFDLALTFLLHDILKVDSQFEENVIKESFKKGGNVIVFFDGFDEISSHHKDIVLNLIQALKKSVKKIFVTCRPYVSELLEETFGVLSYGIEAFSSESKKLFLLKFWMWRFKLNKDKIETGDLEKQLELLADALIDKLSVSINDRDRSFTGIPLQLRMVAEIFPVSKESEEFGKSPITSRDVTLPETLNLVDLYKRFVDKKFDTLIDKVQPGTPSAAVLVDNSYETFIKNHQKIAVYRLVPNENRLIILSDEDIEDLERFLDKIIESREGTGIIDGVIKIMNERQPHFTHLTFAEYFAATFLSSKLSRKYQSTEIKKFMVTNVFVSSKYEVVRRFLNECMGKLTISADVRVAYGTTIHNLWLSSPESVSNSNKQTALGIAVAEDNESIVSFFLRSLDERHDTLLQLINAKDVNGRPAIHSAAENGNLKILQLLVGRGAEVNTMENNGNTVLYYAVKHNLQMMQYLVQNGAKTDLVDVVKLFVHVTSNNRIDSLDIPTLHFHRDKLMEIFSWLKNNGAYLSPNYFDSKNFSLIQLYMNDNEIPSSIDYESIAGYYIRTISWSVIKWVIENDIIDVDLKFKNGNSVLHYAVRKGHEDEVQWLIKSKDLGGGGANVNIVNDNGRSVLHEAASSDNLEIMKLLVTPPAQGGVGVDINYKDNDGHTVLHEAAFFGQLDLLKWLVASKENGGGGADDRMTDNNGQTALDNAALLGQLEIVQLLMSNIADNIAVQISCKKILHKSAAFGELKLVQWLLQNASVDINHSDASGKCLLHYAAKHNNYEVVKWLLDSGAEVNTVDDDGKTALHESSGTGVQDIEEWLEKRGILIKSVDSKVAGIKEITIELKPNQQHFAKYLKEKNYQVERIGFGTCAVHVQSLATLKLLLKSGANIGAIDKHGKTPLYYATFLERPGVVGCDVLNLLKSPAEDSDGVAENANTI